VNDITRIAPRKIWSPQRILASIACVPWAYLAWSGYDLCYGARVHATPGYPNEGQIHLYVIEPLIGLFVSIAILVIANKLPTPASVVLFCFQWLALLPVILPWGGGI
jgi:hypothetical protein